MSTDRFPSAPEGWRRRLDVTRFGAVGATAIDRVIVLVEQTAYDGQVEVEGEFWAVELADGGRELFLGLQAALARFAPGLLRACLLSDPCSFAEMMAVEQGFARTAVVAPGRIADVVLRERGHGEHVSPPRYEDDSLTFQCYRPRRPPSHPSDQLTTLRCASDGTLLSSVTVLEWG